MRTKEAATLNVQLESAPSTPLNLRFGVIYAPRIPTPPFVGFSVVEPSPNRFDVQAYICDGTMTVVFSGDLATAYRHIGLHLRMDIAPKDCGRG